MFIYLKVQETEAEREARLKKWEKFLETGETDDSAAGTKTAASAAASNGSSVTATSSTNNIVSEKSEEKSTDADSKNSDIKKNETDMAERLETGGNTSAKPEENQMETENTDDSKEDNT